MWSILTGIVIIYLALVILVYLFQSYLIYFPDKTLVMNPGQIGISYEKIFLHTSDHVKIHSWYMFAENPKGTILFCHGNAGNISHRFESIQIFYQLGLNVFIFDYRGFGKSDGKPDEEGTYKDAEAAWDYLINEKKISPDKIIIFGRSLGSAVAAWLAKEKQPAAVILESSFTSVPDMAAKIYPFLPVRLLSKFDYPTKEYVAQIRSPKLFIHSKGDELIPFSHGQKNFELAAEPKQFLEIHGSHNDGFVRSANLYQNGLENFINEVLLF